EGSRRLLGMAALPIHMSSWPALRPSASARSSSLSRAFLNSFYAHTETCCEAGVMSCLLESFNRYAISILLAHNLQLGSDRLFCVFEFREKLFRVHQLFNPRTQALVSSIASSM